MPKLTMDDVDKRLDEIRSRATQVERPDVIPSLLERVRGTQLPRPPKPPKMPRA